MCIKAIIRWLLDIPEPREPLSPRQQALLGSTVVAFNHRGCMASDHVFMWVGVVTGFRESAHAGTCAAIKIVKQAGSPYDCRDKDYGTVCHPIEDTCLQQVEPKLFLLGR